MLRLLQAVLPSWDKTERSQDMKFLVEKLFSFLGSLLSTCSSDLPLLRGTILDQAQSWFLSDVHFKMIDYPRRRLLKKEEVPPTGLSDGHTQQHAGRGDRGRPAYPPLPWPVEQPNQRLHQLSIEFHWRRDGRLPV